MNVNTPDVSTQIAALITSGRTLDVRRLADPSIPLEDVAS